MSGIITSDFLAKCAADFKRADVNGDGFLDFEEFKAGVGCNPLQVRQVWNIFQKFDLDGNGKMDLDEFIAMAACLRGGDDEVDETLAEFLLADKDHNGYILPEEMYEHLVASGSPVAHDRQKFLATFKAFDANGDGKISFEEFKRMAKIVEASESSGSDAEERMAFLIIDTDCNGYITPDELHQFCLASNPDIASDPQLFKSVFNLIDVNGDGKISFEEFKRIVQAHNVAIVDGKVDQDRANFFLIDADGDGYITMDEFNRLLRISNPGVVLDQKKIRNLFNKFDFNCDGRLSFDEFKALSASI